ncbi:MAG: DNA-binding protein [Spirochaetia bacterium]|nr:DNA-binding protein [Spirochaetia bacterium]
MKVTLDLPNEKFNLLEQTAKDLGLEPAQLMESLLNDQISTSKEDFEKAANYVLQKNKELYKRLA